MLTRPLSSLFLSCSQSYLQAASDGPASHGLDPSANYNSPKFRSRNQSYMRAVSTLSQASCVSQVGPLSSWSAGRDGARKSWAGWQHWRRPQWWEVGPLHTAGPGECVSVGEGVYGGQV